MQAQISDIRDTHWDAIVIGTGVGGGVAGRALAEAGLKVLFLEKGRAGFRAEETALDLAMADPVARSIRGFWPDPIQVDLEGTQQELFAPLGAGIGGSSVFYAATLERPEPHDLDDLDDRPHPVGGWPVSFEEMRPWFDAAQAWFHLHGEPDPLSDIPSPALAPPHPASAGDEAIMQNLRRNGLHPYRLHTAVRHIEGCKDCLGQKCPKPCKMDGRSAGVEPALQTGNAAVLTDCEVSRLVRSPAGPVHVEAILCGTRQVFSARHVVLAAGALSSPRLLLASKSEQDPTGLGNHGDQVGRNLMFHLNEIFALWPGKSAHHAGASKSVGFRDLYFAQGQRLGMVQAMGIDVGYGEIVHHLRQRVARSWLRRVPAAADLTRIPAAIGSRLMGTAKVFVGLLEDLPIPENRVLLDDDAPGRIHLQYKVTPELLARRKLFRKLIKTAFRGTRTAFLTYDPEPNFGHPCGTLRMGVDVGESVVNRAGHVHGLPNLWVTDASVFPTSMGVNPSLTIAANAMRVAANIKEGP